jgi:hypothetical protein
VQGEPEVMVDRSVVEGEELELAGWAIARHGGVASVEVLVDGALRASAPVGSPRPDVAAALGAPFAASGWRCRVRLPDAASPGGSRRATIALRAVDRAGVGHVARIGTLEALLASFRADQVRALTADLHAARCDLAAARGELAAYRGQAEAELAGLRARLAAMEASRFWKLRNAWFAVKRALRLTDER